MLRKWCAPGALLACVAVGMSAVSVQAADVTGPGKSAVQTADALISDGADSSIEPTAFQVGSGIGPVGGGSGRRNQWFVGAEYLQIRASFSENISFVERDLSDLPDGNFRFSQFDFDYGSSYRMYGGYRVPCCGCEVRFTYSNFASDASFTSPTATTDISYVSPLEVVATLPGQRITGDSSVKILNYDLGVSKTIPLGSPLGCCDSSCGDVCCGDSCGDCCGDGCCGAWCPAWDITWSGALRFANVDVARNFASSGGTPAPLGQRTGSSSMEFDGGGMRTGLLGRRYIGKNGVASLFLKGDISLLLGDVTTTSQSVDTTTGVDVVSRQTISCTHVIPVTELEAGGTVYLTKCMNVSAGYLLAAWHDLGIREEYDFGLQTHYDDANILGLDGWFIRAEAAF